MVIIHKKCVITTLKRFTLCLTMALFCAMLAQGPVLAAQANRKLAAIFKSTNGRDYYSGVCSNRKLLDSLPLPTKSTKSKPAHITYKIWLFNDQKLQELWVDTHAGLYGLISNTAGIEPGSKIPSVLKTIIASAGSQHSVQLRHAGERAFLCFGGRDHDLATLTADSDLIVLASPIAVLYVRHEPRYTTNPEQFTTFLFLIRQYVTPPSQNAYALAPGPIVKVVRDGGDLPWATKTAKGVGYAVFNIPPFKIGQEYMLFLALPKLGQPSLEAITTYPDEYSVADAADGAFRIVNGLVTPMGDATACTFPPNIIGLTTADAMHTIQNALHLTQAK